MELNRIWNSDCVKGMNDLPAGSIDLVFADPPFNIGYKYDVYEDRMAADEYLQWTRQWGKAVVHCLKSNGTFWLAIGDDFAAELKLIFQRELGLTCRSWVIWYYTFGVNCKSKFSRSHTHLFHFVKDPKAFTFNADDVYVKSARQLVYADSRADSRGRLPDDTWVLRPQDLPHGFQPQDDTWYVPRVCGTFAERAGFHGCQMPERLLERIIRVSSNVGDVVLDPFGGSGTTLIVAKKLGRQFLGFELSKNYAKRIEERLGAVKPFEGLAGPVNPQSSAPSTKKGKRLATEAGGGELPFASKVRAAKDEIDRGIVEAFLLVRDGWSADRVIADPDFNHAFLEKCARLGVAGSDSELNRRLLALRKSSRLKGLPESKRVSFPIPCDERERMEFALEIAIQKCKEVYGSLDDILCNPKAAAAFDNCVYSMIPKPYPSFAIRWLALGLRKRATKMRRAAETVESDLEIPSEKTDPFDPKTLINTPEKPGIYWIETQAQGRPLYIGSCLNLRKRLDYQFVGTSFDFWGISRSDLTLACLPWGNERRQLWGQQSRQIGRWKPEGNYEEFAYHAPAVIG
jgi:site-specific DNA-methyltransferase (adenine-specific)